MKSLISILIISLLFLAGASCAEAPARQYPCQENEQFYVTLSWLVDSAARWQGKAIL